MYDMSRAASGYGAQRARDMHVARRARHGARQGARYAWRALRDNMLRRHATGTRHGDIAHDKARDMHGAGQGARHGARQVSRQGQRRRGVRRSHEKSDGKYGIPIV